MDKNPLIFFVYPGPKGSEENQFTAEYSAWGK
jgi:dipeptidyl aminopeptidase/acylaminoacyl peptidase